MLSLRLGVPTSFSGKYIEYLVISIYLFFHLIDLFRKQFWYLIYDCINIFIIALFSEAVKETKQKKTNVTLKFHYSNVSNKWRIALPSPAKILYLTISSVADGRVNRLFYYSYAEKYIFKIDNTKLCTCHWYLKAIIRLIMMTKMTYFALFIQL